MTALDKTTVLIYLAVSAAGLALILAGHVPVVEATGYVAPFPPVAPPVPPGPEGLVEQLPVQALCPAMNR